MQRLLDHIERGIVDLERAAGIGGKSVTPESSTKWTFLDAE